MVTAAKDDRGERLLKLDCEALGQLVRASTVKAVGMHFAMRQRGGEATKATAIELGHSDEVSGEQ